MTYSLLSTFSFYLQVNKPMCKLAALYRNLFGGYGWNKQNRVAMGPTGCNCLNSLELSTPRSIQMKREIVKPTVNMSRYQSNENGLYSLI